MVETHCDGRASRYHPIDCWQLYHGDHFPQCRILPFGHICKASRLGDEKGDKAFRRDFTLVRPGPTTYFSGSGGVPE